MQNKELVMAVIVGPDGQTVQGLGGNAPLELIFLALLTRGVPVAIKLVPASEFHEDRAPMPAGAMSAIAKGRAALKAFDALAPKPKRVGKMDQTLRLRAECPGLISAGPAADMLSILSDRIAGGK